MKALVYTGVKEMSWQDVPDPEPSDGEVEINVEAVGICGSDLHAYMGHDERRPAPLILGHEASGRATTGRYKGKRVVFNPLVTCGICNDCLGGRSNLCSKREIVSIAPRQGAFAEKVVVPEINVVEMPDGMDPAKAALTEPVATAHHAVGVADRALWRSLGECRALVIGGGAVGLSAALILRSRGCQNVTVADTNELRRKTAGTGEGLDTLDPITDPPLENRYDLVIDAAGGRATRTCASHVVKPGGVIIHIGLMDADDGLDIRKLTLQEITFIGIYTYTMVDFRATIQALHAGTLGKLEWIEKRSLADGGQAFQNLYDGNVAAAKIILTT
jgi:2-desacetyl-2-hydroxyethyl bacteriochlorophyllide A dehydrogenase